MKAITVKHPFTLDHVVLSDVVDPGMPGKGELRVAIKSNSLNYHDFLVATGALPTDDGRILLSDGAGIVEAVGEGVTDFKVGDAVVSTFFPVWPAGKPFPLVGGFTQTPGDGIDGMGSEYVVRGENAFTHAPAGWSHIEAATITTSGLTAWRALVVNGNLKAGQTVLVQGTGGVSIAALQLAKSMGANVIATSSCDAKLKIVKELGADETINYKTTPEWGERVLDITNGIGVDHIVEVGGPATLNESLKAIKVGGHIAMVGLLTGNEALIPVLTVLAKQVRIESLIVGSRQDQIDYIKALEAISKKPIVDAVFKPENLGKAFEHMKAGSHLGKICIEW